MSHATEQSEHELVNFPGQRPNEHVILLLRRHWTALAAGIFQLMVLLFIPPIVLTLILLFSSFNINPEGPLYILLVLGLSLYYLFCFLTYFNDFIDYHLDIWIVTDQRILSIEQTGLFKRTISELNILKVQDVTSEINGKIETFLDFGNVYIQTAGQTERFIFEEVSHPAEVGKVILQVHDRAEKLEELEKVRESEEYRTELAEEHGVHPQQQAKPSEKQ